MTANQTILLLLATMGVLEAAPRDGLREHYLNLLRHKNSVERNLVEMERATRRAINLQKSESQADRFAVVMRKPRGLRDGERPIRATAILMPANDALVLEICGTSLERLNQIEADLDVIVESARALGMDVRNGRPVIAAEGTKLPADAKARPALSPPAQRPYYRIDPVQSLENAHALIAAALHQLHGPGSRTDLTEKIGEARLSIERVRTALRSVEYRIAIGLARSANGQNLAGAKQTRPPGYMSGPWEPETNRIFPTKNQAK